MENISNPAANIEVNDNTSELHTNNVSENSEGHTSISKRGILYESEEFKQVGILKRLNLGINEVHNFLIDVENNYILHFSHRDGFKSFIYKRLSKIMEKKKAEVFQEVLTTLNEVVQANTIGTFDDSGLQLLLPSANGNVQISVGVNNYDLVKPIAGLKIYNGFQCTICCNISRDTQKKPFYSENVKLMRIHIKTVHKRSDVQYSLCKVQKAFSNNKTPFKNICNSYFGVKVSGPEVSTNTPVARYSNFELMEILEKSGGFGIFTESQSNITAMHLNSKFFERSKFQNLFDSWPHKDLFRFVDKDDLEGHKFLIEKSVASYYNKVDTILKDTSLSHQFTSDLMILSKRQSMTNFRSLQNDSTKKVYQKYFAFFIMFCVRIQKKKHEELGNFFFCTLDVNTQQTLESFVLKLKDVQEKIAENNVDGNLFFQTPFGKNALKMLVSEVHKLHLSIMKQQFNKYESTFKKSIHCLFLMCRCIKVTIRNER
ncbi:hypothetical protein HDU92_006221, partial [Lobulomyces angularis]